MRALRYGLLAAAVIAAAVAVVPPASAQLVSPFGRNSNDGMSKEDLALMRKSIRDALGEYKEGVSKTWTSKASGRAGKSTVNKTYQQAGMQCAHVTHEFTAGPGNTYSAPMCKDPKDGSWKLAF